MTVEHQLRGRVYNAKVLQSDKMLVTRVQFDVHPHNQWWGIKCDLDLKDE